MKNPLIDLFHETIAINNLVGNTCQPTTETLRHQLRIIHSEADELAAGIKDNDRHEIRDGIADVMFTLAGLYGRMGLDIPQHLIPRDDLNEPHIDEVRAAVSALHTLSHLQFDTVYAALNHVADYAVFRVWQLGESLNVDILGDFKAVILSNRTKFDRNREDAEKTRLKYAAIGVDTYYKECGMEGDLIPYYITFSSRDQTGDDGRSYPANKWLKSINFQDTNFHIE